MLLLLFLLLLPGTTVVVVRVVVIYKHHTVSPHLTKHKNHLLLRVHKRAYTPLHTTHHTTPHHAPPHACYNTSCTRRCTTPRLNMPSLTTPHRRVPHHSTRHITEHAAPCHTTRVSMPRHTPWVVPNPPLRSGWCQGWSSAACGVAGVGVGATPAPRRPIATRHALAAPVNAW